MVYRGGPWKVPWYAVEDAVEVLPQVVPRHAKACLGNGQQCIPPTVDGGGEIPWETTVGCWGQWGGTTGSHGDFPGEGTGVKHTYDLNKLVSELYLVQPKKTPTRLVQIVARSSWRNANVKVVACGTGACFDRACRWFWVLALFLGGR